MLVVVVVVCVGVICDGVVDDVWVVWCGEVEVVEFVFVGNWGCDWCSVVVYVLWEVGVEVYEVVGVLVVFV